MSSMSSIVAICLVVPLNCYTLKKSVSLLAFTVVKLDGIIERKGI